MIIIHCPCGHKIEDMKPEIINGDKYIMIKSYIDCPKCRARSVIRTYCDYNNTVA